MFFECIILIMVDLKILFRMKVENYQGKVNWVLNVKLIFIILIFIVDRNVSLYLIGIFLIFGVCINL